MIRTIDTDLVIRTIKEMFMKGKSELLLKGKRQEFLDIYDSCKTLEKSYKSTENEIKSFFDYYYVSVIRKLEAKI